MRLGKISFFAIVCATLCLGANVQLPGGTLTISGTSTTGTTFTYSGTLTGADTISFVQTQNPCLRVGNDYCTNGAGVITSATTATVGTSSPFSGPSGTIPSGSYTYGSLVMIISGVGAVQVFPTTSGNGLGSSNPPLSLSLPTTTLSSLGFGSFTSAPNPTITFIVGDTGYTDNSGQFVLTQSSAPPVIPEPSTILLMISLLAVFATLVWWRRRPVAA